MKWAVIVLMQPNGFVMKYEKINISHLGICYSCSIVSPTSFLPTSRIIGISQTSEMRRCSCLSALMRTLNWRIRVIKPYQSVFASKTEKYVENNILSRSSAWLEHASHIREDFGSIPMWRSYWIILHIREFFNILFVGWLVINRQ